MLLKYEFVIVMHFQRNRAVLVSNSWPNLVMALHFEGTLEYHFWESEVEVLCDLYNHPEAQRSQPLIFS